MQPKVAYLIDEGYGWDEGPNWVFYEEKDLPYSKIEHASKDRVKRIVYWEIPEHE